MMDTSKQKIWGVEANVETLKRMWSEGYSAELIAREIPGATRNAVVGKVYRLGLSSRPTTNGQPHGRYGLTDYGTQPRRQPTIHRQGRPREPNSVRDLRRQRAAGTLADKRSARLVVKEAPPPFSDDATDLLIPHEQRCMLIELNDEKCHWPVGDPCSGPFFFCGAKTATEPYCAAHAFRSRNTAATLKSANDAAERDAQNKLRVGLLAGTNFI